MEPWVWILLGIVIALAAMVIYRKLTGERPTTEQLIRVKNIIAEVATVTPECTEPHHALKGAWLILAYLTDEISEEELKRELPEHLSKAGKFGVTLERAAEALGLG